MPVCGPNKPSPSAENGSRAINEAGSSVDAAPLNEAGNKPASVSQNQSTCVPDAANAPAHVSENQPTSVCETVHQTASVCPESDPMSLSEATNQTDLSTSVSGTLNQSAPLSDIQPRSVSEVLTQTSSAGSDATNQSVPGFEATNQSVPGSEATNRSAPGSEATSQSAPAFEAANQSAPGSDAISQSAPGSEATNQSTLGSDTTNQSAPGSNTTNQSVLGSTAASQSAPCSEATNQSMPGPKPASQNVLPSEATSQNGGASTTAEGSGLNLPRSSETSAKAKPYARSRKDSRSFRSFQNASRRASAAGGSAVQDVELPDYIWRMPSGLFKCVVCEGTGYYLSSLKGVKLHCQGRRHQTEAAKAKQIPPQELPKLKVTSSGQFDPAFKAHSLTMPLGAEKVQMTFTLTNVSQDSRFRFLRWHGPYLNGELRLLPPTSPSLSASSEEEKIIIAPGESLDLTMEIIPKVEDTLSFKVYFRLEDLGRKVDPVRYASVVVNCPVQLRVVREETRQP